MIMNPGYNVLGVTIPLKLNGWTKDKGNINSYMQVVKSDLTTDYTPSSL